MTAPFKPTLESPGPRGSATSPTVVFTWTFNGFTAGVAAYQYSLRRRRLSPTITTFTYWTGSVWTGTQTWVAAPGGTDDGELITVSTGAGWVNDEVWEWSVNMRNTGLEESGWADSHLLAMAVSPTATFVVPDPATDSRPTAKWVFVGGTNRRQQSIQLALYDDATKTNASFNPQLEAWQDLAVWKMDSPHYSSLISEYQIGIDLASGTTYHLYYKISDDLGYTSVWLLGDTFATSLTPPAAPTLTVTKLPGTGTVQLDVASTFNLLGVDEADFATGLGSWYAFQNTSISWTGSSMLVTVTGMSYSALDTAHTDYTAENTAYATFAAQRDAQSGGTNAIVISHLNPASAIPVVVGNVYSAIANFKPINVTRTCEVRINWYTSGGAYISASAGTPVSCPANVFTSAVVNGVTAPATAAFALVFLQITSAAGAQVEIDSVAMSRTASIGWTPGGLAVDVRFVLQKRIGTGEWQYLWGASREHPLMTQNDVSSQSTYYDRSAILGIDDVQYRAYTLSSATGPLVYSTPTAVTIPAFTEIGWWLRSVHALVPDMKIRVADFDHSYGTKTESVYPRNDDYGFIVDTTEAPSRSLKFRATTIEQDEYDALEALLRCKDLLYIQRNIGDGFHFYVTGDVGVTQKRAVDATGGRPVRHYHEWSFSGEIVSPQEALA